MLNIYDYNLLKRNKLKKKYGDLDYALLLLYSKKNDIFMNEFFEKYGSSVYNNTDSIPIYTCYEEKLYKKWVGEGVLIRKIEGTVDAGERKYDKFKIMQELGDDYMLKSYNYPSLIVVHLDKYHEITKDDYYPIDLYSYKEVDNIFKIIINTILTIKNHYANFGLIKETLKTYKMTKGVEINNVPAKDKDYEYVKRLIKSKGYTVEGFCDYFKEMYGHPTFSPKTLRNRIRSKDLKNSFLQLIASALELNANEKNEFYKYFGINRISE